MAGDAAGDARGELAVLLAVYLSTRLLTLFLLRPGGYFGDWSDFTYFRQIAELSDQGYYPYIDFWVEYPPLFPWLAVALHRLELLLPAWRHPLLWFGLSLSGILLAADAGTLWLVRRIGACLWGERGGLLGAWTYAGLFLPLYALAAWFDPLPVFCLVLGLELLLRRRAGLAGLACGLGIALKLYPVILLPVALRALWPATSRSAPSAAPTGRAGRGLRPLLACAAGAVAVPAATLLPFALLSPTMLVASLQGMLNRRSWETLWALLDGFYGTGGVPALRDRLLYPESALWSNPSRLPWGAITLAFALAYGLVWWRAASRPALTALDEPAPKAAPSRRGPLDLAPLAPPAVVALLALTAALFLLYARGFSQQFTLALVPIVVLLAPSVRGVLYVAALVGVSTLAEGYVWVNVFPDDRWLLRATVGLRTALLALLAVEATARLLPGLAAPWRRLRPGAVGVLGALALLLALGLGLRLARLYWQSGGSPAGQPRAELLAALQATSPETALLYTQQAHYSAAYPYTRPRPALLVADDRLPDRVGPASLHARLVGFTAGRREVALVEDAEQPPPPLAAALRRWLRRNYQEGPATTVGGARLTRYAERPRPPLAEPVAFGDALALEWVELAPAAPAPGEALTVQLGWRARRAVGHDYTVFVHLLDLPGGAHGEERIVAQHDSPPLDGRYPTGGWRANERVADEVVVLLPPDLPPGTYQLAVGLYDRPTLARLPARGGPAAADRALLGAVEVRGQAGSGPEVRGR